MSFDPVYTAGIQKAINEKARQRLVCDGAFGNKSREALKTLQGQLGIPVTGTYDAATEQRLDSFIRAKYLTMDSFSSAANNLGVTPAHVRTVCAVESNGAGFLPDGRAKILFERHHFLKAITARLPANVVEKLKAANPDIINAESGGYVGNEGEYSRFERAAAIDEYSAIYATSFGLFQIMGFNFKDAGYSDVFQFAAGMRTSETNQLMAFVNFNKVYKKGVLWNALRQGDWVTYALNYNGTGYAKNQYDTKLASNFNKYTADINAA